MSSGSSGGRLSVEGEQIIDQADIGGWVGSGWAARVSTASSDD